MRNAYKILVSKPEGKRPIGTDLKETAHEDVDWIHVTRDRFQWRVFSEYDNEPPGSKKKAGNFSIV
jgi:hypothetical protein